METEKDDKDWCYSRINIEMHRGKAEVPFFWGGGGGGGGNYTEFKWKVNIFSSEHLIILY